MRILLAMLLLSTLAACTWLTGDKGYLRDRSDDYRKARVEPMLKVPASMDDEVLQDIFVIPPVTEDLRVTGEFEVPRPAPLVTRATEEMVRVQRLADEEWILANFAPGQLWPQVRAFLNSNSLQVGRVDARAGLIETGWLQPEGGGMDERYRFRMEQGVQRNTSELHVLQMFQAGDINSWPEVSADRDRENNMLMLVAQYLADSTDAAPVSMMAQEAINAGGKVSIQEDAGEAPYIRLELPFYRAWASVERALRESSFQTRDRDRSSGYFYIRYVEDADDDSGWFDWLFNDGEKEDTKSLTEFDFVLTITEQAEGVVRITIAREDAVALTPAQAQSMLALIKGNIN
jgi:outer membrane protein assembly factor BamC